MMIRLILIAVFLSGCALQGAGNSFWGHSSTHTQLFNVVVDSLASPKAKEYRTYVLLPGNDGVTIDDLQFQEYASYLTRALNHQGFILANKAENADIAIVLSYGIGDPQTLYRTYTLPVWGKTGAFSSHTYGTATSFGDVAKYSGTTTYTPEYGVVGYKTGVETKTVYVRNAVITAYDFKEFKTSNKQIELWRTTLSSTGPSGDLREAFPFLISASVPYLGINSGKRVSIDVYDNDDMFRLIRGESTKTDDPQMPHE